MITKPKGFVLIIDIEEFSGGENTRKGSDKDVQQMKVVFSSFGFQVKVLKNLFAKVTHLP